MNKNFYNLLLTLKKRPLLFLGEKSLERLFLFISGYLHCMQETDNKIPSFLPGFQEFIEKRYKVTLAYHWSTIIEFFEPGREESFDKFYKLLEEFTGEKFT